MLNLSELLDRRGFLVLDGGLASELEREGHDLDHELWSARLLVEDPDSIAAVHRRYLEAGADVITTAAYQAALPGLRAMGLGEREARTAYMEALRIARRVRDEFPEPTRLVAASIGPYGAYLADGSEYRGNYEATDGELADFHGGRIELLAEAAARGEGPDLLAIETIPSADEAELVLGLLGEHPQLEAWVTFSCLGTRTCEGQPIEECARLVEEREQVLAVGVNCTAPSDVPELLARLLASSSKPLVCYPNSGEDYDARTRTWSGENVFAGCDEGSREWLRRGAKLVGGCCRTTPEDIARLVEIRSALGSS